MLDATVVIHDRFRGPPRSGNGGYSAGLLGARLGPIAQVTLRRPPPLGEPLTIHEEGEGLALVHGDAVVAEGRVADAPAIELPEPPSLDEAERATPAPDAMAGHPFPTCFVCGPHRDAGDGMHVFVGKVDGREMFAGAWRPSEQFAGADGALPAELVWAALDCPGGVATALFPDMALSVLGRMTAVLRAPVRAGESHVVAAWPTGAASRRYQMGTAIWDAAGALCAYAEATWVHVNPADWQ